MEGVFPTERNGGRLFLGRPTLYTAFLTYWHIGIQSLPLGPHY